MEWLNDKSEQINKPLKSDSAEETEVLVERVENVISQLEKKKKVINITNMTDLGLLFCVV